MKPPRKNINNKKLNTRRALIFSLYLFPFMLNLGIVEFLTPVKFDIVLSNLPFIGLLITIAWFVSTIFDFAVGRLTDKIGVRKTIFIGALMGFIGTLLFGFSNNYLFMTLGILIWGFSFTFLTIPAEDYILSKTENNKVGSAYGVFSFLYSFAYAIAPLIGLMLYSYLGINWGIIIASVLCLATISLLHRIKNDPCKEGTEKGLDDSFLKENIFKKGFKDISRMNAREISILLNMFIFGTWFTIVLIGSSLLFFVGEDNLVNGALLAFAFMLPLGIIDYITGKYANLKRNIRKIIPIGLLISGIMLIIFYFVQSFWLLLVLAAVSTIFANMAWVATEVSISSHLPKGKKGEFMGIFLTGKDLGFDFAPLIYGLIAILGLKVPFLFLGILLLSALVFYLIGNKKERK